MKEPAKEFEKEQQPPFFKTWKGMYTFVLAFLATLILLFHLFTKIYE